MALVIPPHSPDTPAELMRRASSLAGFCLGELADLAAVRVPADFRREKGWIGQLIEILLGAQAGSKPQQDFPELGIELKTIPVNISGKPLETTYVCFAPLTQQLGVTWETSNVRNKLARVLWLPILGERQIPIAERIVGTAFLWQPNAAELTILRADWEEIMDKITLGEVETITAHQGEALQLRPKAANGRVVTDAIGADGQIIKTRPRGFYLRTSFTQQILQRQFA